MSAMEWQPISTAPRDGRQVWLFDPNVDPEQFVGSFGHTDIAKDHPDYWEGWLYADEILCTRCNYEPEPTHWMPLPKAPAKTKGGRQ